MNETPGSTEDAKDRGTPAPGKSAASDPKVKFLIGAVAVFAVVVGLVLFLKGDGLVTGREDGEDGLATTNFFTENVPKEAELEDLEVKPPVPRSDGEPVDEVIIEDIVEGSGPAAKTGDTVEVQYVGALFEDGTEFDSTWSKAKEPFPVTLGQGGVIEGWEEGLVGIKAGGRRGILIPSELGYGATGLPPNIPPDAALIFIVDAEKVTPQKGGGNSGQ